MDCAGRAQRRRRFGFTLLGTNAPSSILNLSGQAELNRASSLTRSHRALLSIKMSNDRCLGGIMRMRSPTVDELVFSGAWLLVIGAYHTMKTISLTLLI